MRLFTALVLLGALATSLFLGAVLFLMILGLAVLLAVAFYVRFWWLRRKRQRQAPTHRGNVLEGEYTVEQEEPVDKD